MQTLDIVLTLVFSVVMLIFMAFPAMKITEWLYDHFAIHDKYHNFIMFSILVALALSIGIFLRFA